MKFNPFDLPQVQDIPSSFDLNEIRIRVTEGTGLKERWRMIKDLKPDDKIHINPKTTLPYIQREKGGRREKRPFPQPSENPKWKDIPALKRRKDAAIANDPLVRAIFKNPDDPDVLDILMHSLAQEAAALKFDRDEMEKNNPDLESSSALSVKRIGSLQKIAESWLRRKEALSKNHIDLNGAPFQAVFELIISTFVDAMRSAGVHDNIVDDVMRKASTSFDDPSWAAQAKMRMKNSVDSKR